MLSATVLMTNGSQTEFAAAMASQPTVPITVHTRNQNSRSWVRSDHRPTR